ncbi:MAG TPA: DUF177 domain-containing protein [Chitinophagaceae bacterium]|nr:DUF177 domain-containing protein [Chitinophagaceae bacterium]
MGRRDYDIAFVGLKQGAHEYQYQVDDKFFEPYQPQDFRNCRANIKLTLDKQNGFMLLRFEVGGTLEVTCDRCGSSTLPMQLWDEFNVVVKMAEDPDQMNAQEEDPDVHYIGRGESHLHIADWLYEFVNLSIPMQRMCSEEKIGSPYCDKEVLAMLKREEDSPGQATNPIWKGLEAIKKNLEN